jgi:hypothetical protein
MILKMKTKIKREDIMIAPKEEGGDPQWKHKPLCFTSSSPSMSF